MRLFVYTGPHVKGLDLAQSTVWAILVGITSIRHRAAVGPPGLSCSGHWPKSRLACNLITVGTVLLRRLYVFMELDTRRVSLAASTSDPTGSWVTQQARNLIVAMTGPTQPRCGRPGTGHQVNACGRQECGPTD